MAELSGYQAGILTAATLVESLGLISMCVAFQAERTSVCSMVANLAIVYAAVTDVFYFKESLSTIVLLGCAAVILMTTLLGLVKLCARNNSQQMRETTEDRDDDFFDV